MGVERLRLVVFVISKVLFSVFVAVHSAHPFLSLEHFHNGFCDYRKVSHKINIPTLSTTPITPPLLVFTSTFAFENLAEHWSQTNNHSALVLLSASELKPSHESALFSLLRQPHVFALHTTFDETKQTEHDETVREQLLSELAVFEMRTGFIIPFYVNTNTTTSESISKFLSSSSSVSDSNSNSDSLPFLSISHTSHERTPLFHINFPPSTTFPILHDQIALNYIRGDKHRPLPSTLSSSKSTSKSSLQFARRATSILDFLDHSQLVCILARLQCHIIAPSDPIFLFCLSIIRRIPFQTIHDNYQLKQFVPLSTYSDVHLNMTSFKIRRADVARAVQLAKQDAPERKIRKALFHPYFETVEDDNVDVFFSISSKLRSIVADNEFFQWVSHTSRLLATCFFFLWVCDVCLKSRVLRKYIARLQGCEVSQRLSRAAEDRAKLI